MKLLLTSIGGGLGSQRINNFRKIKLHRDKLFIIGIDTNLNCLSSFFCDKFYKVSKGSSRNFIKDIFEIVVNEKIDLIIPGSDEEALKLAQNKIKFENIGCKIETSDYNSLKILSNKSKTYNFLEKYQLGNPNWNTASSKKDLKNKVEYFFDNKINEIIIKPSISRGSRDIICISNKLNKEKNFLFSTYQYKEYKKKLSEIFLSSNTVIMEKYDSDIYDCDIHSVNGKLYNLTLRKRLNKFLPNEGHIIINPKEVISLITSVTKLLKLSSVHDFDLMIDKQGKFKIIEINPRMSGSICTSILAGASYYEDIILIAKNKKILAKKAKKNKIIVPSLNLSIFDK